MVTVATWEGGWIPKLTGPTPGNPQKPSTKSWVDGFESPKPVKLVFVLGGDHPNVTPNIWKKKKHQWYTLSNDFYFELISLVACCFKCFFWIKSTSNIPKFLGESAYMAHSWKCLIEAGGWVSERIQGLKPLSVKQLRIETYDGPWSDHRSADF